MTTPDVQRLLAATEHLYDEVLADLLPRTRGACYEISCAAFIVGVAMQLPVRLCRGSRLLPGNTWDKHGWVRIGDVVLHSPRAGEVELVPWSDSFREEWGAGA